MCGQEPNPFILPKAPATRISRLHNLIKKFSFSIHDSLRLRKGPGQSSPWWESNVLWGGAAIVFTVIAAMTKDLRWMLILAWPCFTMTLWKMTSMLAVKRSRKILTGIGTVFIAAGIYGLNVWLRPTPSPSTVVTTTSSTVAPIASKGSPRLEGLSMKIGGFITTGVEHDSTRIQVTVIASNDGDPTSAGDWNMKITTSNGTIQSRYAFGEPFTKGSLEIPRLDVALQQPIGLTREMPGYVSFIVPHVAQSTIDNLHKDTKASIIISVRDSKNREVYAERSISELWAERHVRQLAQVAQTPHSRESSPILTEEQIEAAVRKAIPQASQSTVLMKPDYGNLADRIREVEKRLQMEQNFHAAAFEHIRQSGGTDEERNAKINNRIIAMAESYRAMDKPKIIALRDECAALHIRSQELDEVLYEADHPGRVISGPNLPIEGNLGYWTGMIAGLDELARDVEANH
jgi:hypothetical protein